MTQFSCEQIGCTRKGYWIEVAENGEPLFCFRTRHDGDNHSVKMTLGQIMVAAMPKLLAAGQIPNDIEVTANYLC
jgi:hypothetical protein